MNNNRFVLFLVLSMWVTTIYTQEVSTLSTVSANGGITVDDNGILYVANFGPLPPNPMLGRNLYKITPDGNATLIAQNLNVGSGNNISNDGFLYQSNFATSTIYKFSLEGDLVDNSYATVNGPVGIATDSENSLYICSCSTGSIIKIDSSGNSSTLLSSPIFNCVNGITIDQDDNLYATSFNNGKVFKVSPSGSLQEIGNTMFGNGHIAYSNLEDVLYIASYSSHQIFRMDLEGNTEVFAGTGTPGIVDAMDPLMATFDKPNGIELSPDNCLLYVSQDGGLRKIRLDLSSCLTNNHEQDPENGINIYPNPGSGLIFIENNSNLSLQSISFIDTSGKIVLEISDPKNDGIDIKDLSSGMFVVMIKLSDGTNQTRKIVVE